MPEIGRDLGQRHQHKGALLQTRMRNRELRAIEDQVVWVKIADTVKVKMSRSAISTVLAEGEVAKDQAPS